MKLCDPKWMVDQLGTLEDLYGRELPALIREAGLPAAMLSGVKRVYAIGNGDSCHAALAAAPVFETLTGVSYRPMPAFPFLYYELPRLRTEEAAETLIVGLSASGSSKMVTEVFQRAGERGVARTLALSGKADAAVTKAADESISAVIAELGRSPGIRTFAASLCGLYALAGLIGRAQGTATQARVEALAGAVQASAAGVRETVEDALRLAPDAAALCGAQFISLAGSGAGLAAAQFAAAKITEGSGVFAAAQDLEEWNHVESMAHPLTYPVAVLGVPGASLARAERLCRTAGRVGHPVVGIAGPETAEIKALCDVAFPVHVDCGEALAPLYYYIPAVALSHALAAKHGRAMFLSDQAVDLFGA